MKHTFYSKLLRWTFALFVAPWVVLALLLLMAFERLFGKPVDVQERISLAEVWKVVKELFTEKLER